MTPHHCGPLSSQARPGPNSTAADCIRLVFISAVFVFTLRDAPPAIAHEGEQHGEPAPGATVSRGPVQLTEESKTNLGLQTEEAQLRPIENAVRCFGIVEGVPDKVNFVSIRVPGRASQVLVNQGDAVKAGQLLAEIEGRQIGDPPPILSVRATIAGVVTQRNILVGESIEPDKPLFQIADLSEVRVKCEVYEVDVGKVRLEQRARIHFEAFPERSFEGAVESLGGELASATRSLPVWIRLSNKDLALRPNMRGDGRIVDGVADATLTVPVEAVLGDAGNYFVYLDTGGLYERTPVVLGARDNRFIEIADGLVPGDQVVTRGNYQLQFAASPAPVKSTTSKPDKVGP